MLSRIASGGKVELAPACDEAQLTVERGRNTPPRSGTHPSDTAGLAARGRQVSGRPPVPTRRYLPAAARAADRRPLGPSLSPRAPRMTRGPGCPGRGPLSYQPAVYQSFGTSRLPSGRRPSFTKGVGHVDRRYLQPHRQGRLIVRADGVEPRHAGWLVQRRRRPGPAARRRFCRRGPEPRGAAPRHNQPRQRHDGKRCGRPAAQS